MAEIAGAVSPSDEMRAAEVKLRAAFEAASCPPWRRNGMAVVAPSGTVALAYNGVDADWIAGASPVWAEPFADLLAEARRISREHTPAPDYPGPFEWCQQCNNEECDGLVLVRKVLAVARSLNGAAS